jgi:hypothetical protein
MIIQNYSPQKCLKFLPKYLLLSISSLLKSITLSKEQIAHLLKKFNISLKLYLPFKERDLKLQKSTKQLLMVNGQRTSTGRLTVLPQL